MATNQKSVYASDWTTHGGKIFKPGDEMTGRVPDYALSSALESGVATDSSTSAQRAKASEAERAAHVAEQIAGRSEKRGPSADA